MSGGKRAYILGIDLGGTNLKIGLSDQSCTLLSKQVLNTTSYKNKEELIDAVTGSVHSIIGAARLQGCPILGIGLGLPGPIDAEQGIVHFFPNIPGWREVRLAGILKKRLSMRVIIDNDANLMALAEARAGAAAGARNAVCITLGTGVGGGLIIDGQLYRGSTFAAGELGHIPINETGPACGCGSFACVESYVGNRRIMAAAAKAFKKDISLEELSRLARDGNRKAIRIWEDVGGKLGIALAGVVNLLNPDRIVIGGGVANAGPVLFNSIKKTLMRRAMPMQAHHVKVCKAKLSDAGIIGACLLVKESLGV